MNSRLCHKTKTCSHPNSSLVSSPRQRILDVTPGIGFLGNPARWWHLAGCLLDRGREPPTSYPVPCVHWLVTVGWCFTPGLVLSERTVIMCPPCQRPVPFWALRSGQLSQSLHDDAYTPLISLSIVTCWARSSCLTQSLSPFFPASDN